MAFAWLTGAEPSAGVFHVSTNGDDAQCGSSERPFATLCRAQSAVREAKRSGGKGDVKVVVHGGTYRLHEPLLFEPEDSGSAAAPVVIEGAAGERAVIDGGVPVTGWRPAEGQLWVADLPDVKRGAWSFRQLFINGESRPRARIPNQGFLRVAVPHLDGNTKARYSTPVRSFGFKPGDLNAAWTNLRDVEVTVFHFWTDTHLKIQSVDSVSNVVTFADNSLKQFTDDFSTNGARYVVENVFEGLDQPGEWYLNRTTGQLFYWPVPGEDMARAEVVAPRLASLMELRGDPEQRRFVEHLTFRRLVFQHAGFELPAGEVNCKQGAVCVPAAVTLTGARACSFERCELRNLGTYAVDVAAGCRDNRFVGNALHHLAAGGFRVNGGVETNSPLLRTAGNAIDDNEIHHYGEVFPSAVGVLLMQTDGNSVSHNHIYHGYYTGVSVGWVWGYLRSVSRDNRIEFNHIHDIGRGLLSDMGAIYTLGVSPGTTVRNNLIHDVDANLYGGWGIYHDQGSAHILVENNVVYDTKFSPFNIHFAKEITVRNNVFACGRLEQLSRGKMEPHTSVYFENNIVYWKEGPLFKGDWKDKPYEFHHNAASKAGPAKLTSTFEFDWNLYYNPTQTCDQVSFAGDTWQAWQARGKDRHSRYADPLFVDAEHRDFRLRPESPAWDMGFRAIDLSAVGPRTPAGL